MVVIMPFSYKDRTKEILTEIQSAYEKASSKVWYHNGSSAQDTLGFNIFKLLLEYIKAHPDQEVYNFMDFGSGNGSLGKSLKEMIEGSQHRLNKQYADEINKVLGGRKAEIRIFNLTGNGSADSVSSTGKEENEVPVIMYDCYGVKIEDVQDFLGKYLAGKFGLEEDIKFDVVVSKMTFVHLVDPIGTLQQVYDMLRTKSGILIADGIHYSASIPKEGPDSHDAVQDLQLMRSIELSGGKYLLKPDYSGHSKVIIERGGSSSNFGYEYKPECSSLLVADRGSTGTDCASYEITLSPLLDYPKDFASPGYHGDESLFRLVEPAFVWHEKYIPMEIAGASHPIEDSGN